MDAAYNRQVKCLYFMGVNPLLSDPDATLVEDALRELGSFVVQDIFLIETAKLAHVVLPATSCNVKDGTFTNTERRVQPVYEFLFFCKRIRYCHQSGT
jgi:predicted molibdopterin-dependent oxidoreductase YjgC